MIIGGKGGEIEYFEPQFIEDDLNVLVSLGLLDLDYNNNGSTLYVVTRYAVKYLSAIDTEE